MIGLLGNLFNRWRSRRLRRKSRHRKALENMPSGLYEHWRRTVGSEFRGTPGNRYFFTRAAEGLMDFFDCVRRHPQPCALPSRAADSVWHAWSRFDSAGLNNFCMRHFGRVIPHVEGDALGVAKEAALANCLVQARRAERLGVASLALPRLFKLDGALRMPGGYGYVVSKDKIGWRQLDQRGLPFGPMFLAASLAPLALLDAGLVSQLEYDGYHRRMQDSGASASDGGGSSLPTGSSRDDEHEGAADSDSGSDSGSDGGSSCGSSCGSGCGGGD